MVCDVFESAPPESPATTVTVIEVVPVGLLVFN
jgi:hypothetical protein